MDPYCQKSVDKLFSAIPYRAIQASSRKTELVGGGFAYDLDAPMPSCPILPIFIADKAGTIKD